MNDVDNEKEGMAIKKHLLKKHGLVSVVGTKRTSDQLDQWNSEVLQSDRKKVKYAEEFEEMDDIFGLKD